MRPKTNHPLDLSDSGSFGRLAAPLVYRRSLQRRRQARVARLWLPVALIFLLAIGPFVGYAAYDRAEESQRNIAQARFEELLGLRAQRIAERMVSYEEVLHACQGLYDSSVEVERHEFATFTRQALGRHPCIRSIAWAPRLAATGEDGKGAAGYPLAFIEPPEPNAHRLGQDIAANPALAETLARALAGHGPALSEALGEDRTVGVVALGVYARTDEKGIGEPIGAVLLTFGLDDLLAAGQTKGAPVLMDLEVHDVREGSSLRLIGRSGSAVADRGSGIVARQRLPIAGRDWLLRAAPTATFLGSYTDASPVRTGLLVFVMWELFGGLLLALGAAARSHAVRRQGRTLSRVLQSLGEAVVVAGQDGRVRLSNEAAHQLIGESADHLDADAFARAVKFRTPEGVDPIAPDDAPLAQAMRGAAFDARELLMYTPTVPGGVWVSVTGRPLRDEWGKLLGGVLVLRDVTAHRRSEDELREKNDRLRERKLEMDLAASVQKRLYPRRAPDVRGLDIAGAVYPADETCGDYYDFLSQPDGSLCLAVGDVSGHGLGPALVMAEVRAYIHSLALAGEAPAGMLSRINEQLCKDLADDLFVTMMIVRIGADARTISYASAGHTPALLVGRDGGLKAELGRTGLPLGMFENRGFESRNGYALEEGDVLVLMTDGATEATSPAGDFFEETGVLEVVRAHRHEDAESILARVDEALRAFSKPGPHHDDVTLVVCKGGANRPESV